MFSNNPYLAALVTATFWCIAPFWAIASFAPTLHPFYIFLISLNIASFVVCAVDKLSSASGRRVPESMLWLLALFGGGGGLLLGMRWLRHKTRKASFQLVLALILVCQLMLVRYVLSEKPLISNLPISGAQP